MAYEPILPSSLLKEIPDGFDLGKKIFNNVCLRVGVVVETLDIDNINNLSKTDVEYHVMVMEQEQDGGTNASMYKNCITMDAFGGIADFFEFKKRATSTPQDLTKKGSINNDKNDGSMVLLLCIDGNAEKGIIVGAIRHPSKKTTLTKENGQHAEGEFNGVNWQVNKDGEFTVTFKSATDNKGKPKETHNTHIKLDKTGSAELSDGVDSIRIDKPAKLISVRSSGGIIETATENYTLSAKNVKASSTMDLVLAAQGRASFTSAKDMSFESQGVLKGSGKSIELQSQSMIKIQGNQMMVNVPQIMLGAGATPAVTSMTQVISIGNLGIPIVGNMMGPFSGSVFIGS